MSSSNLTKKTADPAYERALGHFAVRRDAQEQT